MFVASHEGMFGGRDFAYLTWSDPGEPVTPIGSPATRLGASDRRRAPAPLSPRSSPCCSSSSSRDRIGAGRREEAALGSRLCFFAVATACEAVAQRTGWSPALFRSYYLAGGVLTVVYLGAGSAWLLLRPRARDVLLGALAVGRSRRPLSVWLAPVDERVLATTARAAAGERRARRACVPMGGRLNSVGTARPGRRIAVLDRPPASRARERLDRALARSWSPRDGPVAHRRLLVRVPRASSSGSRSCSAGSRSPGERSSPSRFASPRPRGEAGSGAMTIDSQALQGYAAEISRERLTRTRGRLRFLSAARAESSRGGCRGRRPRPLRGCLLDIAASDASLAAVLA